MQSPEVEQIVSNVQKTRTSLLLYGLLVGLGCQIVFNAWIITSINKRPTHSEVDVHVQDSAPYTEDKDIIFDLLNQDRKILEVLEKIEKKL